MSESIPRHDVKGGMRLAIASSLVAASGGLLFGYDIGIISGALLQLRKEFEMSCLTQEMLVSCVLFGAVISSLFGGAMIDWSGRKFTMMINCVVFITGALILCFASSVGFLIAGRILLGFAIGLSVIAECAYIAEISSPKHRGKLVSFNEVAIAVGFLLAYLVNYLCILLENGWRIMFGLSGIIALLQAVSLIFIPKSPRFLVIKGNDTEALKVLKRLRENEFDAREELSLLQHSLSVEKRFSWRQLISTRDNMHYRLMIGFGLVFFQQCSGLPSILYYSPVILKHMGFESDQSATLASLGAGITKTIAVIVSLLLVDKVGRKKLLICGSAVMAICLFIMAQLNHEFAINTSDLDCQDVITIADSVNRTEHFNGSEILNPAVIASPAAKYSSLLFLLCYVAAYSIGYGPVTWLVVSEIFPSSIKGRAMALVTAVNWSTNLLISFTFLNYLDAVGLPGAFVTNAVACCLAIVFIILLVPETKGRVLEEINTTINSISLPQEMKHQFSQTCCCCCKSLQRSDSYEPLANGIALAPVHSISSSVSSNTEQII